MKNLTPSPGGILPDHPAAKLCRPGTVSAGPVPGAPCGWIRCSRDQCPTAPAPISTGKDPPRLDQQQKRKSQSERPAPPALAFLLPAARPDRHRRPISTGKDRAAHGDGLPDLPGLGGVGLPDEQRTARPITCPGCSFQPDTAAALMTPPPCCPHPCQTYRHRQPPARQHPAASPTPEGSDSPPNGIWL